MSSAPKSAEVVRPDTKDEEPRQGMSTQRTAETPDRCPTVTNATARPAAARDVASNILSFRTEVSQLNPSSGNNDMMMTEGGSLMSGSGKDDSTAVETQNNSSHPDWSSQPSSDDKGSGTQNHETDGDEEGNRGDVETASLSEARDDGGTKRHLWTSADDSALAEAMRSTGMGTFYVKGKYLPVGEVDWDLVTETFNQNTRSSRFSKKQVKDRWEQHKRPCLLKHKSLPKAARQKIISFLHENIGTSQYEARGRRLVRWIDLTMDLWEIGITCSTSTTKNVWNSYQSKTVRDAPIGSRSFDNQPPMASQFDHQPPRANGSKRPASAMDDQSSFLMREDSMSRRYSGYPYPEGNNAMPDGHHSGSSYEYQGQFPHQPHHRGMPRHFQQGHREGLPAAGGHPSRWDEHRSIMHAQPRHAPGPRYGDAPFPGRAYFNSHQEQRAHPGRPYPESNSQMHYRSYGNFPDAASARALPSHAQQGGARSSWQGSASAFHDPPTKFRHTGHHAGRFPYGPADVPGPSELPSAPGQQQSAFQRPVANGSDAAQAKQSSGDNYNPWWRDYML